MSQPIQSERETVVAVSPISFLEAVQSSLEAGDTDSAAAAFEQAAGLLDAALMDREPDQITGAASVAQLKSVALAAMSQGQFDLMDAAAARCVALARQLGWTQDEAEGTSLRAAVANFTGRYDEAGQLLRAASELFAEAGDTLGQAKCLNNLGSLLANLGEHAEALAVLFQCHQLLNKYSDGTHRLRGACLANIGHTYSALRQHAEAREYLQLALDAAREQNDLSTELAALSTLGLVFKNEGDARQAAETLVRGLDLATIHEQTRDIIDLSDSLGQVYAENGQLTLALEMHQRSLDAATLADDPQGMSNALLGLGRAHAGLGRLTHATEILQRALDLAQRHALRNVELAVQAELSSCFEQLGDIPRAFVHHKHYHRLERAMFSEESESRTRALTERFASERARLEAETYRQLSEMAQTAREEAEETVQVRTAELEQAQIEMVTRLGFAAEYRDDLTGQHTLRVGDLSYRIALAMNMPAEEAELLRWAARLHDIGKIGISDAVLLKPGRYTPEEFDRMKLHTVIGAKMLENSRSPLLRMAEQVAISHHERWDGKGYPRGLSGTDIPVVGRIVAVADVYDALTTERPYKPAWHPLEALREVRSMAGTHLDPRVVECLERIMSESEVRGAMGPALVNAATERRADLGMSARDHEAAEGDTAPRFVRSEIHARVDRLIEESWSRRESDPQEGMRLAIEALDLAQQYHYMLGTGYAYRNMGFFHFIAAEYEQALSLLHKGAEFGAHLGDIALQSDCTNYSAGVYNALTYYEKAIEQLSLTMKFARESGDTTRLAHCLHNLGIVTTESRDYTRAEGYLADALQAYRSLGDVNGEAKALSTSANLALERGDYARAVDLSTESIERARQVGSGYLLAAASSHLGKAHAHRGEHELAIRHLNDALEFARSLPHPVLEAWSLFELGTVHIAQRNDVAAREVLLKALDGARISNLRSLELQVYRVLSEVTSRAGDAAEALEYYRLHHETERAIFDEESALKTRALTIQLEVERAKADAEIFKVRSIELTAANEALERLNQEKSKLVAMLQAQSKLLERQVMEDALTGLYNRRHVEQTLAREFRTHREAGEPLAVAMIDIDHFKQINDHFSHLVGDQVLRTIGMLFRDACRPTDIVARYGGEEFLIVFPGTTVEQGKRICERIGRVVAGHAWHEIHPNLTVTLSMGVSDDLSVQNHEKLVGLADARLYEAKDQGRNRVVA